MKTKNILIIKFSWIGDILFTLPAFYLLKQQIPNSRITVLTAPQNKPVFTGFPAVERFITFDRKIFKTRHIRQIWQHSTELYRELASEKYDLVIDYQGAGETAFLSYLTGAPERLGFIKNKHKTRSRFYTHCTEHDDCHHRIDQSVNLLTHYGLEPAPVNNRYDLPVEKLDQARRFLGSLVYTPEKPLIYLQPFSGKSFKNWPLENYLTLARYWKNNGVQVIFGGGPADAELLKPATDEFPTTAGKTDLLTSAGVMKLSSLIIGNDTGPLHLAVALQKRVIMLMGPSDPTEFGPYQHPEWVVRPVHSNDINHISPNEVIQASVKALSEIEKTVPRATD